jgi:1-acylglycerone phosphate reductase
MKAVLITGCSAGSIGHALALAFHARKFHVFATARSLSKMSTLSSLPNVTLLALEVTSSSDISAAVTAVANSCHQLHHLVNNAGTCPAMPVLDWDIEKAKVVFNANLWGTMAMCQAFMPFLLKTKGCFLTISTVNVYLPTPWMGVYSASKAAQQVMMETLRGEVEPLGMRVLTVVTGRVDTPGMSKQEGTFKLPQGSLYESIKEKIRLRAEGVEKTPMISAEKYAEKVVKDAEAGKSGLSFRGGGASAVWFAHYYCQSIFEYLVRNDAGMKELRMARKHGQLKME